MKEAVLNNLATALEEPELYPHQNTHQQMATLLVQGHGRDRVTDNMITDLMAHPFCQTPHEAYKLALKEATKQLSQCSLMVVDYRMVSLMEFYSTYTFLAPLLTVKPRGKTSLKYCHRLIIYLFFFKYCHSFIIYLFLFIYIQYIYLQ